MASNSKASDEGAWIAGVTKSFIWGMVHLCVPVGMVALDICLGPQFIKAYGESRGIILDGWTTLLLYVWSAATTGYMFMLVRIIREGINIFKFFQATLEEQIALLAAVSVTLLDSVVDDGGATSIFPIWGPEVGMNIKPWQDPPPEFLGASAIWWGMAVTVFVICAAQEFILKPALDKSEYFANKSKMAGAGFTRLCVKTTNWLYEQLRKWSLALAVVCVIGLNWGLIIYWVYQCFVPVGLTGALPIVAGIFFGGLLIFLQMTFYDKIREGGFKFSDSWNYVGIAAIAVNMVGSIVAFTWLLYTPQGSGVIFTNTPSPAYWLSITTITIMFLAYPIVAERALALEFVEKKQGKLHRWLNKEWKLPGFLKGKKKRKSDPVPDFEPSTGTLDPSMFSSVPDDGPSAGPGHGPWPG